MSLPTRLSFMETTLAEFVTVIDSDRFHAAPTGRMTLDDTLVGHVKFYKASNAIEFMLVTGRSRVFDLSALSDRQSGDSITDTNGQTMKIEFFRNVAIIL